MKTYNSSAFGLLSIFLKKKFIRGAGWKSGTCEAKALRPFPPPLYEKVIRGKVVGEAS